MRFPLGDMSKPRVRELAERAGLAVARRRDSQDLCFLAGTRHGDFLQRHGGLDRRAGPIVDMQGTVLGEHAGAHVYTVGQRHGLGVSAPEPLYVLATDTRSNTVTVGPRAARARRQRARGDALSRRLLRRRGARARARAAVRLSCAR
jgi:tRNA-specific 2-thiouridylase